MISKDAGQRIDDIFRGYDGTDRPGYVVGIRLDGKLLYRKGVGMASVEHGVRNTPATRMRIGSTTKHFVSLLALMLHEEGTLDVDAGLRTYLPEIREVSDGEPTLRQLMNHTGGIRCYIDLSFMSRGMATMPKGEGLAIQARQTMSNFAPGERMIYCNGGYMLLTLILERTTGRTLKELLSEQVFQPMGMNQTEFILSDLDIHRGAATLHTRNADGSLRRGIFPQEEMSGDGAVLSTVDDMLTWAAHVRQPTQVGSAAVWAQLLAPTRLANGTMTRYGLGLQVTPYRGLRTVHHAGAVIGGACQMMTVPERGLDIVILSNGGPMSPSKLAPKVIDAVFGDDELAPHPAPPSSQAYAHLVGRRYRSASRMVVEIADSDGQLGLKVYGNEPVPLRLVDGKLRLEFEDLAVGPIELDPNAPLDAASLGGSECGNPEAFELLPSRERQEATRFDDLAADYISTDLDSRACIELSEAGPTLLIQGGTGFARMSLEAIGPDLFYWRNVDPLATFRGVMTVQRDGVRVTGFLLDALRTRRIAFTRTP